MENSSLTPEQEKLKADIAAQRMVARQAQLDLGALERRCTHHYVERRDSAVCAICGDDGGWWCAKSPTHTCEYAESDTACDNCIHCGEPSERK